ncbi:MAG TPA: hypothetical protein VNA19_15510 [Pyrinomonadaceae bacterium]|nr:hypothetical protein [Pyrinomonadaceae bacterium]
MSGFNFCPACGHRLQPHFQACPGCGMLLRKGEPATPTPQTQPRPSAPPPPTPQDFRSPHQWMDTPTAPPRQVEPLPQTQPRTQQQPAPYRPPVPVEQLFACPSCGQMVQRGSVSCPHCGRPFQFAPQAFQGPSTSGPTPNWIAIICIAILAAIVIMYLC